MFRKTKRQLVNVQVILKVLSFLLVIESFFMLTGIGFALYYDEPFLPLVFSAIITGTTGLVLWFAIHPDKGIKSVGRREGYLIVSLSWIVISIFGTLPFLFSGAIPSFTDAFFETMSGFTTTGASILNDIESLPKNILYWRAMTHWIGGMGSLY